MDALSQFEGRFLLWIQQAVRQPWLDAGAAFYTKLGDRGLVWIALCLLLLCFPRTRRAGKTGLLALGLSLVCTNLILKPLVARIRPWLVVEGLKPVVAEPDPNSFPSGHSSAAFAFAWACWKTMPRRWGAAILACAAVMALTRLYVGVHFPTDVACGSMVGIFCGWAAWRLMERWDRRFRPGRR